MLQKNLRPEPLLRAALSMALVSGCSSPPKPSDPYLFSHRYAAREALAYRTRDPKTKMKLT